MPDLIDQCRDLVARHCAGTGRWETPVSGLALYRCDAPTAPARTVYNPRLCVVLQGGKEIAVGTRLLRLDAGTCLVATVDMPVTASVREARPDHPHLALTLDLDRRAIADLLIGLPPVPSEHPPAGIAAGALADALVEPLWRLLRLVEQPGDVAVLTPLIEREIHYRLLQGAHGPLLRQIATTGTHLARIGQATAWIRAHYAEPTSIEALAGLAGMSVTSLHRHFKAVTMMTPLQYRARIRLQEARRRLLVEGQDAGAIGFDVGYDSASQFSREYRRMFGRPPASDAARLRGAEPGW